MGDLFLEDKYKHLEMIQNIGWRIDYFIVSESIKNDIKEAKIHTDILGSDHCPVELDIF